MAKLSQFPDLLGDVDGLNRDFLVPAALLPVDPGSERAFVRGIPRVKDWDDGWEVIDYLTGHIRLREAPIPGDAPPALLFLQDVGGLPITEVTQITGCIHKADTACGVIVSGKATRACLATTSPVCAGVQTLSVKGCVTAIRRITGKAEEC